MQILSLIVIAITLAFLPLQRLTSLQGFLSPAWNATDLLLLLAVIFLYGFHLYTNQRLSFSALVSAALASIVILILFTTGIESAISRATTARFLIIIWTLPLLVSLRTRYGRTVPLFIIAALMALHAQWAILQFAIQSDLNLTILGETTVASDVSGVAKFINGSDKLIRSYGPFPHSNNLAGSLLLGLVATVALGTTSSRVRTPLIPLTGLLLIALITTFSRAATIGLIALYAGAVLLQIKPSAATVAHWTPFLRPIIFFFVIALIVFTPLWHARLTDTEDRGITERESQAAIALTLFRDQPAWHGAGPGNYLITLQSYFDQKTMAYQPWQITPVHSMPLILVVELGLLPALALGSALALWLSRRTSDYLVWLIPVVPLILFDHYLLTQTAPLILLLFLALFLPSQQVTRHQRIPER